MSLPTKTYLLRNPWIPSLKIVSACSRDSWSSFFHLTPVGVVSRQVICFGLAHRQCSYYRSSSPTQELRWIGRSTEQCPMSRDRQCRIRGTRAVRRLDLWVHLCRGLKVTTHDQNYTWYSVWYADATHSRKRLFAKSKSYAPNAQFVRHSLKFPTIVVQLASSATLWAFESDAPSLCSELLALYKQFILTFQLFLHPLEWKPRGYTPLELHQKPRKQHSACVGRLPSLG